MCKDTIVKGEPVMNVKSEKQRLCAGTFFTLLVKAKKDVASAHEKKKGVSHQNSDDDILEALIKIFYPEYSIGNVDSFHTFTNNYKHCKCEAQRSLPIAAESSIAHVKSMARTVSLVYRVNEFINDYIKETERMWLLNALVELIECDDEIDSTDTWCIGKDTLVNKCDLRTEKTIYLDWFIADVWSYILVKSRKNKAGVNTYESWYAMVTNGVEDNVTQYSILLETRENIKFLEKNNSSLASSVIETNECRTEEIKEQSATEIISNQILKSGKVFLEGFTRALQGIADDISANEKSNQVEKGILLYDSSFTEERCLSLIDSGQIKPIEFNGLLNYDDIKEHDYIKFETDCIFYSSFDDDHMRCVDVKIKMNQFEIVGRTSNERWKSRSYRNNIVYAGKCTCSGIFEVIAKRDDMIIAQFIFLRR